MPTPRLAPACLAALLLACGPESPDSAVTDATSATSGTGSPGTTTTTATTTTTGVAVTTTGPDPLTGTSAPPNPTTSEETIGTTSEETSGTTALGPCVADPASGTCTDGCDFWLDCCKCDGQAFFPDPMASDCTLAMGIVTATCPWRVWNLFWDNKAVPEVWDPDECAVTESGWYQEELGGDIIIRLCGQACTDYLAGEFTMIDGDMFCEVA